LFDVRRAHLEIFGRQMEADGRMRSTVARRLSTLASLYRYCHVEGILERNPAAYVRRPKVDGESRTTMRYDRARQSLDRHATYIVAAFLAGAARTS
jgi:site-specific recombinase XerD